MMRSRRWTHCLLLLWWGGMLSSANAASTSDALAESQPPPAVAVTAPSPAIEARVTLDTGWDFPLVDVRQPVIYHLQIEHSPQVRVLPESIAPTALRRALVRASALPPELFAITATDRRTEPLPDERIRQRVAYTLRVSKPGTYRLPALQIAYSLEASRRTTHQFLSLPQQGHLLTVDAHRPAGIHALAGDILTPPRRRRHPWLGLHHLALAMLAGGALAGAAGLIVNVPRQRHAPRNKPLSPQQVRRHYQEAFQRLQDTMPVTSGALSPEARVWLRDCATLVRRLLGQWAAAEPTRFEGGAGVSAAMIAAHLQGTTTAQEAFLEPALQLLQELDVLVTAPAPMLTPEDYHRVSEAVQHTILLLTNHEASRVLRASPGL